MLLKIYQFFKNTKIYLTYLKKFQARQILDVEFERLINEGTHRQLGIPSDGRNSASSMGSLGDRSISPVSWEKTPVVRTKSMSRDQLEKNSLNHFTSGLNKTETESETESDLSSLASVKTVSQRRL